MALFQDSGQDPDRRREEAAELLRQIVVAHALNVMTDKEAQFIRDTGDRFEKYGDRTTITVPQLSWLRDLRNKYAL